MRGIENGGLVRGKKGSGKWEEHVLRGGLHPCLDDSQSWLLQGGGSVCVCVCVRAWGIQGGGQKPKKEGGSSSMVFLQPLRLICFSTASVLLSIDAPLGNLKAL